MQTNFLLMQTIAAPKIARAIPAIIQSMNLLTRVECSAKYKFKVMQYTEQKLKKVDKFSMIYMFYFSLLNVDFLSVILMLPVFCDVSLSSARLLTPS